MPRRKKRRLSEERCEAWAKVISVRPKYYVSRSDFGEDCRIDDEAQLELVAVIDAISRKQRKHFGDEMAISLLAAENYTQRESIAPKFFGSVNMRGSQCSALAYLPSQPFWAVMGLVRRPDTWVCFGWEPMRGGYGELTSFFVGDEQDRRELLQLGGDTLVTETAPVGALC